MPGARQPWGVAVMMLQLLVARMAMCSEESGGPLLAAVEALKVGRVAAHGLVHANGAVVDPAS